MLNTKSSKYLTIKNPQLCYSVLLRLPYYKGPIMQCQRKAGDNATQNFYSSTLLDIESWSTGGGNTAGNVGVRILYDQSGNGYNQTQTTQALQPLICENGVLNRVRGKPFIKFNGSTYMSTGALSGTPFSGTEYTYLVGLVRISGGQSFGRTISLSRDSSNDFNHVDGWAVAVDGGTTSLFSVYNQGIANDSGAVYCSFLRQDSFSCFTATTNSGKLAFHGVSRIGGGGAFGNSTSKTLNSNNFFIGLGGGASGAFNLSDCIAYKSSLSSGNSFAIGMISNYLNFVV